MTPEIEMPTDLWAILERAEREHGDRPAVVEGALTLDYAELAGRARAAARAFAAAGLAPGDRVAMLDRNSTEYLVVYFAAAAAGLVLCPLNVRLAAREQAEVLGRAGARLLVAGPELAEAAGAAVALAAVPPATMAARGSGPGALPAEPVGRGSFEARPRAPADVAHLYFTSGTTGRPKGVMLTHGNVGVHARTAAMELGLGQADRWGHIAPLFHLADAWATFAVTLAGGCHVVAPRFEPSEVLRSFERDRITITNLVPTMLGSLLRDPAVASTDLSSVRAVLSGGAPIAPGVVERVLEVFRCEYVQTYGMTETSPYLTLGILKEHMRAWPAERQLAQRCKTGRPFAAVELRVVGDDGRDVPPDGRAVGEIRARGPTVTPGYWEDPEATAAAFEDGWLLTGDLATIDAEGFLDIVDRRKDVILTGGETVYSVEVENALYEHPDVAEAAVYGRPDPHWGERVEASVALRRGAKIDGPALAAFCRERLAGYKVPKRIEVLDALPRTGSGKIRKDALRDRLGARPGEIAE